jgi:hypothetical protein
LWADQWPKSSGAGAAHLEGIAAGADVVEVQEGAAFHQLLHRGVVAGAQARRGGAEPVEERGVP